MSLKNDIVNHYLSLDEDSLYMRFFSCKSRNSLEYWFDSLHNDKNSHYFLCEERDGKYIGVAQLSMGNLNSKHAEVSISVLPQFQRTGLGSQLLGKAISFAKKTGVVELSFFCLLNNLACNELFKKAGFQSQANYEQGLIVGSLTL